MRWKSPSDRVQMVLFSPVILPAAALMFLLVVPSIWITDKWHSYLTAKSWRLWFAWRPIYIDRPWENIPARWVWLEVIERRFWGGWEYRYRDTDGSPKGADAKRLDGAAATAGAEGIAKPSEEAA